MYLRRAVTVLLALTAVCAANSDEDVEDDVLDCSITGKTFVVNTTEKVTWFGGYLQCRRAGMEMAVISNKEEYDRLVDTIKLNEDEPEDVGVWTSGYYDLELGKYRWMTRLTAMNYTVWRSGRPASQNNDHKCVELRKSHQYKMDDVLCMDENYVACQKQRLSWGPCPQQPV